MLKNIPSILPPELLKILCEMGHGDTICIGDANFPAHGVNDRVVRCDGSGGVELLDAILTLFPLDAYVAHPVQLMQVTPGDQVKTPIWDEYKSVTAKHDKRGAACFEEIERFAFYKEARACYAVIQSGERALYANLILKKGVVV